MTSARAISRDKTCSMPHCRDSFALARSPYSSCFLPCYHLLLDFCTVVDIRYAPSIILRFSITQEFGKNSRAWVVLFSCVFSLELLRCVTNYPESAICPWEYSSSNPHILVQYLWILRKPKRLNTSSPFETVHSFRYLVLRLQITRSSMKSAFWQAHHAVYSTYSAPYYL